MYIWCNRCTFSAFFLFECHISYTEAVICIPDLHISAQRCIILFEDNLSEARPSRTKKRPVVGCRWHYNGTLTAHFNGFRHLCVIIQIFCITLEKPAHNITQHAVCWVINNTVTFTKGEASWCVRRKWCPAFSFSSKVYLSLINWYEMTVDKSLEHLDNTRLLKSLKILTEQNI